MKSLLLALAAGLILTAPPLRADNPVVPGAAFPASRYEALWTKSPFSVETSEVSVEASPDYEFVGFSTIEGVSYVSVIEKQNNEHFLISSDKPTRGLTLTSITRSHDGSETYAVVQKNGQPITLKLEEAPAAAQTPGAPAAVNMAPQISIPGADPPVPGSGSVRPMTRFHRAPIHLPPPSPPQQPAPQAQPVTPPPK